MAKIKTPGEYRDKLEELNKIRARRDKPARTKRRLEGETSAYAVELKGKEERGRPERHPTEKKPRRSS
jgi:hypothetical protein